MKWTVIVIGVGLLAQLAACAQEESETLSRVSPDEVIVFSASDVGPIELVAGTYAVETTATGKFQLKRLQRIYQLTPSDEAMNVLLSDGVHSADAVVQDEQEPMAPAQFCNMSDAEKLSAPSFEQFNSGLNEHGLVELQVAVEEETVHKLVDISKQRDVKVEALAQIMLKRIIDFCY